MSLGVLQHKWQIPEGLSWCVWDSRCISVGNRSPSACASTLLLLELVSWHTLGALQNLKLHWKAPGAEAAPSQLLESFRPCRYYLTKVCKTPTLVYRSGALSHIVRENCSSLIRAYYPPLWAFNTHLQTALGGKILSTVRVLKAFLIALL